MTLKTDVPWLYAGHYSHLMTEPITCVEKTT